MKVLNKLAFKNLMLNKKRTISTIIGIILSVSLICAASGLVSSFRETLIQNTINQTGYYHIYISNLQEDDIKNLQNNKEIKDIKLLYDNGYSYFNQEKQEEDNPYIHIYSLGNIDLKDLSYNLLEGRAPKNENEIAISQSVFNNSNYKIGDTIELEVGERQTVDDYELNNMNPTHSSMEKLVNTTKKIYTIVGIVSKYNTNHMYYGISSKDVEGEMIAYCSLKNPSEYKKVIAELLDVDNYSQLQTFPEPDTKYKDYFINTELLRWEAFAFSDSTISMLYAVMGVVLFIIIFASVFCIRNSFSISTTEKIKMYGMLASVGATKKQIKKNVITEALMLGVVGIPIGILSGILAVFVLIKIVNAILGDFLLANINGIIFHISIWPIILSVILGFITIYLSAISSARKASRVSPIEGIRNTESIQIKSKNLKTPKIIEKIFKTGGVLAYKNLKRSKKKYRTTVISLAVSIFIFITMNAFITNMFGFTANYYTDYDYNVIIYGLNSNNIESIDKILSLESIEDYFMLYSYRDNGIKITDKSKIREIPYTSLSRNNILNVITGQLEPIGEEFIYLSIQALDDASFKKYVQKLGLDYESVKESGILCDTSQYYDENSQNSKEIRRYTYDKNDIIYGTLDGEEISIKVGGITDTGPYGLENTHYTDGYLIINKDLYPDIDLELENIMIQSSNPETLVNEIEKIDNSLITYNIDEQVKEQKAMILVINIFLYGFITVITLIGVTNIFNTITSNMELRQKEFAMLKSIGMTKKEFNRMIHLETIFYATKALLYGIILGLLGTFALYKAFAIKIDQGVYIPWYPMLFSAIFVFILVFFIMKYSMSKINKQNTIETIRKENI